MTGNLKKISKKNRKKIFFNLIQFRFSLIIRSFLENTVLQVPKKNSHKFTNIFSSFFNNYQVCIQAVDQELLDKLTAALGDAAAGDTSSDVEMDDLDDKEMEKMDERLAAAFKAMAPKAGKEYVSFCEKNSKKF